MVWYVFGYDVMCWDDLNSINHSLTPCPTRLLQVAMFVQLQKDLRALQPSGQYRKRAMGTFWDLNNKVGQFPSSSASLLFRVPCIPLLFFRLYGLPSLTCSQSHAHTLFNNPINRHCYATSKPLTGHQPDLTEYQ